MNLTRFALGSFQKWCPHQRGGGGSWKSRRSKGDCGNLIIKIRSKCGQVGRGSKIWKFCNVIAGSSITELISISVTCTWSVFHWGILIYLICPCKTNWTISQITFGVFQCRSIAWSSPPITATDDVSLLKQLLSPLRHSYSQVAFGLEI